MGNQTSLDQNFINSQNYTNARQLGSSRFLRTFHCAYVNSGGIIIKQFSKPPFILMDNYLLQLNIQKEKLSGRENCCLIPYIIAEAPQNIFLQRQYFMHNLYDRISTRPFYVNIERVWIAYQLLKALAYSDSLSICHGDVKCENIMISSCNWLYLCDFASYKPTYLPQDDPTDYSFFFDSSNRRACYLAPERFTASASSSNELNNHKMDVFSAGCVIAELFLDGTPLFSYSQILQYKSCQYSPTAEIERIENPEVKEMVYSMISLDPNNRKNATDYLEMFPPFFSKFYSIFSSPSFFFSNQDERITFLNRHVNDLLAKSNVHPIFTPVMDILGDPLNDPSSWLVPSIEFNHVSASPAILLLPVFCSFRNVSSPSIRIIAIENLVNISRYVEDSIILDRIVPALMDAVENDPVDWVKANSLLSLTLVLSMVSFLPSSDATIYEDYIFPGLNLKSFNSSILLKCTFARCFPSLCFSALKGLENRVWEDSSFEMALNDLHSFLFPLLLELLTDQNPIVKRIILYNITDLCVFFDRSRAGDILGHCITFLNDKDWALRSAFFEFTVGLCVFIGEKSFERFIFPVMLQTLMDSEESVIENVLIAFRRLADLSIMSKMKCRTVLKNSYPLLIHPNSWLRAACVSMVNSFFKSMTNVDRLCLLVPILKKVSAVENDDFEDFLMSPVSRELFKEGIYCASKCKEIRQRFVDLNSFRKLLESHKINDIDKEKLIFLLPFISKYISALNSYGEVGGGSNNSLENVPRTLFLTPPSLKIKETNALNIETISLTEKKNLQNPLGHGNKSSPSIGLTNATATAVGELVNEIENIDYSKLSLLDRLVAKKTRLVFPPNLSEYPSCRMNLLKKKMKIENWKPKGLCIFSLSEHTKCVNQVLVSMDSLFFASCSDDGTVKIWDCNRLEKNVANRSRSTYAKDKPIKCMCFIYATHAIACGYGACIDIFKVAYISNNARYGKNSLIQQIHVPSGSRVTAIIHFNRDVLSILSFSTHTGEIYGYELRTNSQLWNIRHPIQFGQVTCMCVDSTGSFMIIGSQRGILSLLDVRFQIISKSWVHPSRSRIHSVMSFSMKLVAVAAGNQVSIWNVETSECIQVVSSVLGEIVGRSMRGFKALEPPSIHQFPELFPKVTEGTTLTSFYLNSNFILTADRNIRFWDLLNVENSFVLGGGKEKREFKSFSNSHTTLYYEEPLKSPMNNTNEPNIGSVESNIITSLVVVEIPSIMIISSTMEGLIKVWK